MSDLNLNGFADFVSKQNPDEKLNHWVGFSQCAVGQYVVEQNPSVAPELDEEEFHQTCVDFVYNLPNKLMITLNSADDADEHIPTYGKLNEFLQEFV